MLTAKDLNGLLEWAEAQGFLEAEIYAEVRFQTQMSLESKLIDCRLETHSGVSIHAKDRHRNYYYCFPTLDISLIKEQLDSNGGLVPKSLNDSFLKSNATHTAQMPSPMVTQLEQNLKPFQFLSHYRSRLESAVKPFYRESIEHACLNLVETQKYFSVAQLGGKFNTGFETEAKANSHWVETLHSKKIQRHSQWARLKMNPLFDEIEETLSNRIESSLDQTSAWPAPQGKLPVLWSAQAIAKLVSAFLTAFEGDRFLTTGSFLQDAPIPIPLAFNLWDRASQDGIHSDHEGTPRKDFPLFIQGRPKGLACTGEIAKQLEVKSTGHARRSSYLSKAKACFWNPQLQPKQMVANMGSDLEGGLFVDEIEIENFQPQTGNMYCLLKGVRLWHAGHLGDRVKDIPIHTNVLEILKSLAQFSDTYEVIGVPSNSPHQSFIQEIKTPSALSPSFEVPGEVPSNHYW